MNTASAATDVRDTLIQTGHRAMAAKGFSAVGLKEILDTAGVPKGSFYHYFDSKDAYGRVLLEAYFHDYLAELEATLRAPGLTMAQRLQGYFQSWRETQSLSDCQGKCLAVKLGAEVADLSEGMRQAMKQGVCGITERLARAIEAGIQDGSLAPQAEPAQLAQSLYQLWLGASVVVKIAKDTQAFDAAMASTRQLLDLPR